MTLFREGTILCRFILKTTDQSLPIESRALYTPVRRQLKGENVAIAGSIQSLGTLLRDIQQFEVPDFQRNYSWQAENVDSFLEDLIYASKNNKLHFLGSTILMKKTSDPQDRTYQIIDGQQRLTTIFTVIAIIRDLVSALPTQEIQPNNPSGVPTNVVSKANDYLFYDLGQGKTRFVSNYLLRTFLSQYVFRHPSPDRPSIPARHQNATLAYRKAYKRIELSLKEKILTLETEDRLGFLDSLLTTLGSNFSILKIETADQTESYDIFMTLNNRGLALGPSDLVKSLIMKHLTKGLSGDDLQMKNAELTEKWAEATDSIDDGDMNQFLRHYLLAIQTEGVRSKDIFKKIEDMVERSTESPAVAASKLLEDIVLRSGIYASLLKPSEIQDEHVRSSCLTMREVLDSYRILLLNVLDGRYDLEQSQRRELARLTEILSLRWVLTGGNAQKLEDHFQQVSNLFRIDQINYNEIKSKLIERMPLDEMTKSQFQNEIESSSLVRTVLHKINGRLNDPDTLIAYDPRRIHVEHIAPESMTDDWMNSLFPGKSKSEISSEYASLVENWGNKTLLDRTINLRVKQRNFEAKRDGTENFTGYTHTMLGITKDLARLDDWSIDEVKRRNEWIAECFIKIWSVESKENELINYSEFRKSN